jgi:hypothetical protein
MLFFSIVHHHGLGLCFVLVYCDVQHDGKLLTCASKTSSYHASLLCITMILSFCLDLFYYYVQHDVKILTRANKTSSYHVPLLCIAKVLCLCLDLAYCDVLYMATHHLCIFLLFEISTF